MADLTADSHPNEYSRPPVYGRPPGGMPELLERVLAGQTQAEAIKPETHNG